MKEYNWKQSVIKYVENAERKHIVIVGSDFFTLEIVQTILQINYPLDFIVTTKPERFKKYSDIKIEDMKWLDENASKEYFFLGAMMIGHKELYTIMINNGKKLGRDFAIMGIGGYTKLLDSIDSLLTLNRTQEDIVGFHIFDNCNITGKKIVVLGNSTSDPSTGNIKSWSEMMYEMLDRRGVKISIFNGAITGYSSTQEFLKLNRDVLQLKPDVVISFSGYNDVEGNSTVEGFPFLHKYQNKFYNYLSERDRLAPDSMYVRSVSNITHGLKTDMPDYMIWLNNMRKMEAICQLYKIKFYGFLQPMVDYKTPHLELGYTEIIHELLELTHSENLPKRVSEFCENLDGKVEKYPFINNLTNIFEEERNVYYDTCHYTEKGNRIIAEQVLKYIEEV